jgi:hypothetical protein
MVHPSAIWRENSACPSGANLRNSAFNRTCTTTLPVSSQQGSGISTGWADIRPAGRQHSAGRGTGGVNHATRYPTEEWRCEVACLQPVTDVICVRHNTIYHRTRIWQAG